METQAAAYGLQPPRASRPKRRSATHTTAHARPHTRERATRQWQHGRCATTRAWRDPGTPHSAGRAGESCLTLYRDRRRRTPCSRRERRSAAHTTAHARPHTQERATRQWQHGRRATARAPGPAALAVLERAVWHSIEIGGGGVRTAASASVGAPRTQQHTHTHTHESAPHVSGSTVGVPHLTPGAIPARPAALAVLESRELCGTL